ncbi:MAG: 23S rRNA (uracil(1939)-C(5))-methyltransferase RlmD, partial [Actinomycetota bacterium]
DPPRAGLTPKAVRRVLELGAEAIVYVSCNPTTLAGNAVLLVEGGYRLESVRPVDMFPHTPHVECVARFVRA